MGMFVCVWERERERKGDRERVKHASYLHATHPGKQGTRGFVQAGFQGAFLGMDMCKLISICECLKLMDQNKIPSLGWTKAQSTRFSWNTDKYQRRIIGFRGKGWLYKIDLMKWTYSGSKPRNNAGKHKRDYKYTQSKSGRDAKLV